VQETDPGTARTFWETEGHSGQTNPPSAQTTGTKGLQTIDFNNKLMKSSVKSKVVHFSCTQ